VRATITNPAEVKVEIFMQQAELETLIRVLRYGATPAVGFTPEAQACCESLTRALEPGR